jgi:hypothetical protein
MENPRGQRGPASDGQGDDIPGSALGLDEDAIIFELKVNGIVA